ncbi:hypothetical protein SAMN04487898_109188 [Pedobacter sp. ok626]|uniref:hypothetical protein n=1 Tax=Pedobacter sp. ok626 TaxID=1761882 RepID=UPI0008813987|nr:hypothetical protein [Pedobacter sp. ok626]SDK58182.1 hypothetical protein SAMN04487898_109188 [Pedobacter sp. ok626]
MKRVSYLIFLFFGILASCTKENGFVLKKHKLLKEEIDTIKYYPKQDLYLLNDIDRGFLGEFKNQFVFVKKGEFIGYRIETGDLALKISERYLGLAPYRDFSSGWFQINRHKVDRKLPKADSISSQLQHSYPDYFIREDNGVFSVYDKGERLKTFHYGAIIINKLNLDFDNLAYGIYCLSNGSLRMVSNDGRKLLIQPDGIYFVPSPGYNAMVARELDDFLIKIDEINSKGEMEFIERIFMITR